MRTKNLAQSAPQPMIGIVLINWNQLQLTLDCLKSLYEMTYSNFKVVVVDNNSMEDPSAPILTKYPETIVLRQAENLGFAEGNNVGFRYLAQEGIEYTMALNNDTVVHKDFIWPMVEALANSDKNLGAVTPKIYFKHLPNTIWAFGGEVDKLRVKGRSKFRKTLDRGQFEQAFEPDYITGCCLLMKTSLLIEFGGFCKDYFAYYEDTDLSYRMKNAGYKLLVIPKSAIWHVAGGSSRSGKRKPPFLTYLGIRNRIIFFRMNFNPMYKTYALPILYIHSAIDILIQASIFRFQNVKAIVKGIQDGFSYKPNGRNQTKSFLASMEKNQ